MDILPPQWFQDFTGKYKAGISHAFLLYFNVRDYVDGKRELARYVRDKFLRDRKFSIVASFDVARGLRFVDDASEREFR